MKRETPLRHLRRHGCALLREGARHSWWHHLEQNKRSAVPRGREIDDHPARKICKDLGTPRSDEFELFARQPRGQPMFELMAVGRAVERVARALARLSM